MALRICWIAICLRERNPKVTIIHQEVCTVFFGCDWIIFRFTNNFHCCYIKLIAKFRALIFFDHTCHIDRCFLTKVFDNIKFSVPSSSPYFSIKLGLKTTAEESSPITQLKKAISLFQILLATQA